MTPFQTLVLRALAAIIRLQLPPLPTTLREGDDQYEAIRLSLELEEAAERSTRLP